MKRTAKHIVCATDFSENAHRAADVAVAIAHRLGASVLLVHVTDQANAFGEATKDLRIAMRKARMELRKEVARLQTSGVVIEEVLLHGRWAEYAIEDLLTKQGAGLVVLSSVSKTAFDRWTLGSVSEYIAQHSPVPTLVVRSPDRLLAWAQGEGSLEVVVAVDFTLCSDAALAFINELRRVGPCSVTVAHINWPPEDEPWSPGSEWALTSNLPSVQRRLMRDLKKKVEEFVPGAVALRVEPNWGRPDVALVHLAHEAKADLIVVGAHQFHGIKRATHVSASRGILRHSPMSVVCVPISPALAHGVQHHPRMQRVLVATDLSASGDQAVPWAYAAVAPGGMVKMVHVIDPEGASSAQVSPDRRRPTRRGPHHERAARARDRLAALVPPASATAGIRTEIEIVEDRDPAHGIGGVARRFGADLICLSTSERPSVAEKILGSVVRNVVMQNDQPVLLVKPEAP
jgi:nucleotide-binding universal stress UspA family protein